MAMKLRTIWEINLEFLTDVAGFKNMHTYTIEQVWSSVQVWIEAENIHVALGQLPEPYKNYKIVKVERRLMNLQVNTWT